MAIKNTTPSQNYPHFSGVTLPQTTPVTGQLTTGGGARTLTGAEALSGLITLDVDDAQTLTLPTATLLVAALPPGTKVGTTIFLDILNFGDATLTIGVGTGGTNVAISGVDAILAAALNTCVRLAIRITALQTETVAGSTNTYDVYQVGVSTVLS